MCMHKDACVYVGVYMSVHIYICVCMCVTVRTYMGIDVYIISINGFCKCVNV